jgi:hypothetical protein
MLKPHPKFPSYAADDQGNIYSLKFNKCRKLSLGSHSEGYLLFTVSEGSKRHNAFAHRFVMECFVGFSDLVVNHKDGDKKNNRLGNLEYVTHLENTQHAVRMGLMVTAGAKPGQNSALSDKQRLFIQAAKGELSKSYLARKFGVGETTIKRVWRRAS